MEHRGKPRWKRVFGQQSSDQTRDDASSNPLDRTLPTVVTTRYDKMATPAPGRVMTMPTREIKTDQDSPTLDDFEPIQTLPRRLQSPDQSGSGKRRRLDESSYTVGNNVDIKNENEAPDSQLQVPEARRNNQDQTNFWRVKNDRQSIEDFVKRLERLGTRTGAGYFEINLKTITHDEVQGQMKRNEASQAPSAPRPGESSSRSAESASRFGKHERCAHCESSTHTLADCPKPNRHHGYIPGCPNCNTMDHLFDECKITRSYYKPGAMDVNSLKFFLRVLVERRDNKPGIMSSKVCWMDVLRRLYDRPQTRPLASQGFYPWTINFSRRMIGRRQGEGILQGKKHWYEWTLGIDKDDDLPTDPLFMRGGRLQYHDVIINRHRNLPRQTIRDY